MSPVIYVNVGDNYIEELEKRLQKHDISHGELARESGISPTQLSRWFNSNIEPTLKNVRKIEEALLTILRKRRRAERRKEDKTG